MPKESTTLIYGTNLSGCRIAYALGKLGYKTVMLNRGSYVDEIKNQVLSQLPLDLCWACGYAPQRLFIGMGALQVLYNSEILEVTGEAGHFKAKVRKRDPFVHNFTCTECDKCIEVCPVDIEKNGEKQKACYVTQKMFWENIYLIDEENCTQCGECEKVCPTGALKLDRPVEEMEIDVGAIILAPEFDEPNEEDLARFGWNQIANVVKNSDIARASLATNFTIDSFMRPSDGKIPQNIAVIITPQFNKDGVEYESYNASAQAIYRANKIKEMLPDVNVTVFCRDYKCFGKGHCRMYERAEENGVEVIRTDSVKVTEAEDDRNTINYSWGDEQREKTVDMTILIFGQKAPLQMEKLSRICGVEADEHEFCKIDPFSCSKTNVPGIFAVGEFTAPKGNPETVWEGYGPIKEILEHLGEKNLEPPKSPALRNVSKEVPQVGVFICSCFGSFNEKMDLSSLADRVKLFPHVVHVEIIEGCCTPPSMQATAEKIKASRVNRAILAVCTPIQKMMKFRKTVMMAGLNPLLTEFLKLREDVIFVHEDPIKMENKAAALIHSAATKLKKAKAAPPPMGKVGSSTLVIGGGPAGMEAARSIAKRGFKVQLVEKSDRLGGMTNFLFKDLEGRDFRPYMDRLIDDVQTHKNIEVFLNATVKSASGYAGNFSVTIDKDGRDSFELNPAIVIIATGARENRVTAYKYGKDDRVMTQLELEKKIEQGEITGGHVAMIQCVGSRNPRMPYCSRVCCSHAIKNGMALREKGIDVTVFYRDINTYGFKEDFYDKAIEMGVNFIRFDQKHYPKLTGNNDSLEISYRPYIGDEEQKLSADYLVLSVGILANRENNEALAGMFNLRIDEDGFFDVESCACPYEDASKRLMKPFEFSTNGVFPVGLAHSPRSLIESLLMARQAAGKALVILPSVQMPPPNSMYVSEVDAAKCVGCGLCVEVCPYSAREIDPVQQIAKVHPFLCESCGACVVACPSGAAFLRDYREEQMISSIDALLSVN